MANPKYSGLPGIAYDEPDIYETCDLPESEQEYHDTYTEFIESKSSPVEVLHISSVDAYNKFKDKTLNTKDVDFGTGRRGYASKPVEWKVGEVESITEKLHRLKFEVTELEQEMKKPEHKEDLSICELVEEMESLKTSLSNLMSQDLNGAQLSQKGLLNGLSQKSLISLIDNIKGVSTNEEDKVSDKKEQEKNLEYNLLYSAELSKFDEVSRIAQLEDKIRKLESLIGTDAKKLMMVSSFDVNQGLLGTVETLRKKMNLLEPSNLDHVEARLQLVHSRLKSIGENANADPSKRAKISELYETVQKIDTLCVALPEIVDRLASIEDLYHEANDFNKCLKNMDASQNSQNDLVASNVNTLKNLQDEMVKDFTAIQSSIDNINKRIEKLPKSK